MATSPWGQWVKSPSDREHVTAWNLLLLAHAFIIWNMILFCQWFSECWPLNDWENYFILSVCQFKAAISNWALLNFSVISTFCIFSKNISKKLPICVILIACHWRCTKNCQWPLKNAGNSFQSHKPIIHCSLLWMQWTCWYPHSILGLANHSMMAPSTHSTVPL